MKKNIIIFFLSIIIVVQSSVLIFEQLNTNSKNKTESGKVLQENIFPDSNLTEIEQIRSIETRPKPIDEVKLTGWLPEWDIPSATESVIKSRNKFDSVSPFWYWAEADGHLTKNKDIYYSELIKHAKEEGILLIPTIGLFDPVKLSSILNNEEYLKYHIETIVAEVINNDFDGIDIDYEATYLGDKQLFFEFLTELKSELQKESKILSVTVLAKWGDGVLYDSLPQTRMVQDYSKIGKLADQFRIMTYEFNSRNGIEAGPVQPINWQEDVIRYTILKGVPREKIYLGIATYAYNYTDRELTNKIEYTPTYFPKSFDSEEKEPAFAHFPEGVDQILAENEVDVEFNSEWGEAVGKYYSENTKTDRIIIFPTQESIDIRKELAAKYGIAGVAYWRIGDEGELNY